MDRHYLLARQEIISRVCDWLFYSFLLIIFFLSAGDFLLHRNWCDQNLVAKLVSANAELVSLWWAPPAMKRETWGKKQILFFLCFIITPNNFIVCQQVCTSTWCGQTLSWNTTKFETKLFDDLVSKVPRFISTLSPNWGTSCGAKMEHFFTGCSWV